MPHAAGCEASSPMRTMGRWRRLGLASWGHALHIRGKASGGYDGPRCYSWPAGAICSDAMRLNHVRA